MWPSHARAAVLYDCLPSKLDGDLPLEMMTKDMVLGITGRAQGSKLNRESTARYQTHPKPRGSGSITPIQLPDQELNPSTAALVVQGSGVQNAATAQHTRCGAWSWRCLEM